MRSLRAGQIGITTLLFGGYAALYFCRADLSVSTPLIVGAPRRAPPAD
jgi:sugar phosphate permease